MSDENKKESQGLRDEAGGIGRTEKNETIVRLKWSDPKGRHTLRIHTSSKPSGTKGENFQQGFAFPGRSRPAPYSQPYLHLGTGL